MCLILDTNQFSNFEANSENLKPVRKWIEDKGKFVYSPTDKLRDELRKHNKMFTLFKQYQQNGKVKINSRQLVNNQKKDLPKLKSNDHDLIALALVSNAKLLVSRDKKLHHDFKTIATGKIYQKKNSHLHLLKNHTCV